MIMNNPQIENLDALSNVKSTLKQFLYLEDNKLLANLIGIRNIKLDSLIQLEISGSESLSACSVPNICEYLDNGGQARIEYNKFGCNSSGEIQSVCEVPLTAYLEGGTFICQGDSTELIITFEGVAPYTFMLAENGNPLPAVMTSDNPFRISAVSYTHLTLPTSDLV